MDDEASCICELGFYGTRCERTADEACTEAECPKNSSCVFSDDLKVPRCICHKGKHSNFYSYEFRLQ